MRAQRSDGARNAERILHVARQVFTEVGPDAHLEVIAVRSGVGIATIFRHFSNKQALVRAALDQSIAEQISPAIDQALGDDNPARGLSTLLTATLSLVARERNTLAAANNSGAVSARIGAPLLESVTILTRRAQEAGLVRADVVADDMSRIIVMLIGVLWTMESDGEGWRRYVALMLDALSPAGATVLPPLSPHPPNLQGSIPI